LILIFGAPATGAGSSVAAQAPPTASSATSSGAAATPPAVQPPEALTPVAAIAAMKGDLLRLVSANEVYFAKYTWYSDNIRALAGYHPSPGVKVTILSADADGWTGTAISTLLPGKSCVVFIGPVKAPPKTDADGRSGSEAVPVCDALPGAERK
jgi:hypothetical protein